MTKLLKQQFRRRVICTARDVAALSHSGSLSIDDFNPTSPTLKSRFSNGMVGYPHKKSRLKNTAIGIFQTALML
ncbi:hypothetical protein [Bergeriella denitrificans]|uniref:hypothetical protein n=1 Tax=Bergeriella denitrificans TaxID=494 RepID=UPI0011C06547|nr:hypothetical protein [Bergeriella denitrificans]